MQELDRNVATETRVPRSIHLALAIRTESGLDFVWTETDTWRKGFRVTVVQNCRLYGQRRNNEKRSVSTMLRMMDVASGK